MQAKVLNVYIGTDITRTGSLIIGGASDNIALGEVVVLDKNRSIMAAGATYADTDKIFIVEGLAGTYDYTNPAGTAVTGVRKLLYSNPIDGNGVSNYSGTSYTVAVEQVNTVSFGTLTPVVGTQYSIRIVYKDMEERPGQVTKTYYATPTTVTLLDLYNLFRTAINGDVGRRVNGTGTTSLILTAKPYNDNETVDSINEYKQVNFEPFLFSDNYASDAAVTATTAPYPGVGTWRLVRDEEKWSQGYEGQTNRILFPVIGPSFRTVLDETYDLIVIKQENWYKSAAGSNEQSNIVTKIFIPYTATSNQMDNVLAVLNPWMASVPKGFNNVSV